MKLYTYISQISVAGTFMALDVFYALALLQGLEKINVPGAMRVEYVSVMELLIV